MNYEEEVIDQKVMRIRVGTFIASVMWIITCAFCCWKFYNNVNDKMNEIQYQLDKRIIMLEIKQQTKADREDIRVMENKLTNIERMLSEIREQSIKKWGQ